MTETKLGQLIGPDAGRDAVHIALSPAIAHERLWPGDHVGFIEAGNTELVGYKEPHVGIVDPYLPDRVAKGQRFFLCLYPQTTTGLRHVWTHPAFPSEETKLDRLSHEWADSYSASLGAAIPVCKHCGINTTHASAQKPCPRRDADSLANTENDARKRMMSQVCNCHSDCRGEVG